MAEDFQLPDLGENIEAGDVVKVLVKAGDRIEKGQPVLELETDKAVVEVPSALEGRVQTVHVKAGDRVGVGERILTAEAGAAEGKKEASGEKEGRASEGEKPARASAKPQEGTSRPKKAGKKAADPPEEKAPAPVRHFPAGSRAEVVDFKPAGQSAPPPPAASEIPAAPSVRRFARQIGLDLQKVQGTGPQGRISIDDVKRHSRLLHQARPGHPGVAESPLPDFSQWGEVERSGFSSVRRKTAQHLARAWSQVPHVTQCDLADITALEAARKRAAGRAKEAGGKLTVTAVVLKTVASALAKFPQFNASIDLHKEEVVFKKYCHIGVAVDTDRGLLVPVIRDVDQKGLLELSVELSEMAERARNAKLTLEEMYGGCFTVSNLGGIGGTYFSPIVNWPEVAILGLSRARMEPVYQQGQFVPRLMLPLSLSYDHRLIDGADAIRFLRWIAEALEYPLGLDG